MREIPVLLRRFKMLSLLFVVFIALYLWQTLSAAPDHATMVRYHITSTQLHELTLLIIVPYIIIWLVGMAGYMWLRNYTLVLGNSKDGRAFDTISKGVLWLVLWLPISVICAGFAQRYYMNHHEATALLIRAINYLNIILLLPAFYTIYVGSKQLVSVAKVKTHGLSQRQSMLFVVFAAFYVFIALSDTARQVAVAGKSVATYYLPDWLTVLTILIPRLLTWFIGLAAVSNIFLYRQKVKGAIYRDALRYVAIGLAVIVLGITVLRIVQSLSTLLGEWSLSTLVLFIYLLLFILAAGYFMLAKGAKRLLKIEES